MAAGEYVSVSSQSDTEHADLDRERMELETQPEFEREELAQIYVKRGLATDLAHQVAGQLMAKDALAAHAHDELGISEMTTARPIQAAFTSAATFAVGAAMPLAMVLVAPTASLVWVVSAASLLFLAFLGSIGEGRRGKRYEGDAAGHLLGRLCDGADRWHRRAGRHGCLSEWAVSGLPLTVATQS